MTEVTDAAEGICRVEFDTPKKLENTEVYLLGGDLGAIIETGPSSIIAEVTHPKPCQGALQL